MIVICVKDWDGYIKGKEYCSLGLERVTYDCWDYEEYYMFYGSEYDEWGPVTTEMIPRDVFMTLQEIRESKIDEILKCKYEKNNISN